MLRSIPQFPDGFRYGASLSAHAVEGGDFASDWWHWEQRPGRIVDGSTSEKGAGHLERYREDAELASTIGLNAALISLSWARIVPERGRIDSDALRHYAKRLTAFRKQGVEPFVVLWDTAVPQWFADRGYWQASTACHDFADYARAAVGALAEHCQYWLPLAQPMEWLFKAYGGIWPGGVGGWFGARRALRHFVLAHVEATAWIRANQAGAKVGHWRSAARYLPEDVNSPWDLRAARGLGGVSARSFQRLLARHGEQARCDFLVASDLAFRPVRFSPLCAAVGFSRRAVSPTPARPGDYSFLLDNVAPRTCPVYLHVTSLSSRDEVTRNHAILDNLLGAAMACTSGVDLRGCFFGPLLDGFEWTDGYSERHGLIHVAHESLARTPNPWAFMLRDIASAGGLTEGVLARHAPSWHPDGDDDEAEGESAAP